MEETSPRGYEDLRALKKTAGVKKITDLLVLAEQNDPFYSGLPIQREKAEWFAALWGRFNYTAGVHLRRVHYQLVSQGDAEKHDGTPYHNTEEAWKYLGEAGKAARYLGLVAPDAFVDRRNPDPTLAIIRPRGRRRSAGLWRNPSSGDSPVSTPTCHWGYRSRCQRSRCKATTTPQGISRSCSSSGSRRAPCTTC
jgi:hypothetical protein